MREPKEGDRFTLAYYATPHGIHGKVEKVVETGEILEVYRNQVDPLVGLVPDWPPIGLVRFDKSGRTQRMRLDDLIITKEAKA
jgi:hypothetical protein